MSKENTKIPIQSPADSNLLLHAENQTEIRLSLNRSPEKRSPANQSPVYRSPENQSPVYRSPENQSPAQASSPVTAQHPSCQSPVKASSPVTAQHPSCQSPAKASSPLTAQHPVQEVPASPPHQVDRQSDGEEVPQAPVVVANRDEVAPATKSDGEAEEGGRGGGGRPRPEEARQAVVVNRWSRKETEAVTMVEGGGEVGYRLPSMLRKARREAMVRKAALGFRILGLIFCLVSFSVMAADKTQGWAGDSFDRYKEYRYCLTITVIGFVYSGFQAIVQAQLLVTGKQVIKPSVTYYFDFIMDQILAYLLMSASSSAATRTEDWVLNWGEDEFTKMATASIGMSFLAFFTFAFSALISGYNLCNRSS